MKIAPMSGMAWSLDILTGQKPFPIFQKERKGEGFKEVLEKEMERNETDKSTPSRIGRNHPVGR